MINKRLEKEQKMGEEGKLKTKATLQGMRSALVAVEEAVRERAIGAKQHMKDLELLHESFGRHLKHGYSSSPSYVAFNLLEKMGSSLAGLKNSVEKCDEGVNNVAVRNAAEVSATMFNSSGKNGETITDTIADICSELERENARLKRELEAANDKIDAGKMDVDNAMKLLPEYRLEIVRARSGMEGVGRELKCEKEANVHLQRRLDECVIALRGAEEARVLGMGVGVCVGGGTENFGLGAHNRSSRRSRRSRRNRRNRKSRRSTNTHEPEERDDFVRKLAEEQLGGFEERIER